MTEDEAFKAAVARGAWAGMNPPKLEAAPTEPTKPKKGGRRSRDKGLRGERSIVNTFLDAGITAERVPLSGAAGGSYTGDLTFGCKGEDWTAEAKVRAHGFSQIYNWLGSNRALFIKADRSPQLVVMRMSDLLEILK